MLQSLLDVRYFISRTVWFSMGISFLRLVTISTNRYAAKPLHTGNIFAVDFYTVLFLDIRNNVIILNGLFWMVIAFLSGFHDYLQFGCSLQVLFWRLYGGNI